jgi:hypothetical protein
MSNKSVIDKEFVPYEEALALKKLGYDIPSISSEHGHVWEREILYQQAFRWFRDKYDLPSHIHTIWQHDWNNYSYQWHITEDKNEWTGIKHFQSYEEAELEGLRKLIEIVKGGNK